MYATKTSPLYTNAFCHDQCSCCCFRRPFTSLMLTKLNFRTFVPVQICIVPFGRFRTNGQTPQPGQANGRSGGSETEHREGTCRCGKSPHTSLVVHTAVAYPGFRSIKQLIVLLLDGMLVHRRLPPAFRQVSLTVCWYPFTSG